jgi:hypothetical protein
MVHGTKGYKMKERKVTPEIAKGLCDMFEHGVPLAYLIKWARLPKPTVMEYLKDNYAVDVRGNLIMQNRKSHKTVLPILTEPDLFACQLALLATIGKGTLIDFFEKVRENYPTVTLAIENNPGINNFYTTPDLEIETDIENDWIYGKEGGLAWGLEHSQEYNERLG